MDSEVIKSVERAHNEIWRRFINEEHGLLFNYTGLQGEVFIPSREECEAGKPNALGWCTPIEDGAFYGGFYLDGLCNRWKASGTPEAARSAEIIAGGLLKLGRASKNYGFIPRGFGEDGKTHYGCSSEDQVFPWFYGLWRYLKSGIPTGEKSNEITGVMEKTALGLETHHWRVPSASEGYGYRGSFARSRVEDITKLLFILRAMYDLTGNEHWKQLYDSRLRQNDNYFYLNQLEVCERGVEYRPYDGTMVFFPFEEKEFKCKAFEPYENKKIETAQPFFTGSMAQAALKGLADMEEDAEIRQRFRSGLMKSAVNAATHVKRYKDFDNNNRLKFELDWRFMNESWKEQKNINDTSHLGWQQHRVWYQGSPRSPYENNYVREPLFAAWVTVLSGDKGLIEESWEEITGMLTHYNWASLYTSTFFMAECVYYEGLKNRKLRK